MRRFAFWAAFVFCIAAALALGRSGLGTATGSSAKPVASRSILGAARAAGAPGRKVYLVRATIPPGAAFAPHHHAGTQVAHVVSGVLRYTVLRGRVAVYGGEADGTEQVVRRAKVGQTVTIRAGEWLVENPSLWHSARNPGKTTTVILVASLIPDDAELSIPVSTG